MSAVIVHNFKRDNSTGALLNNDVKSLNRYKSLREDKIQVKKRFEEIEYNLKQVSADINIIKETVKKLCSQRN